MSDNLIQPCLEEADQWPGTYEKIERERSYLEEITHFEEAANRRMMYVQRNPSVRGAQAAEQADLDGLQAHIPEPRLLTDDDIAKEHYFGLSKQFRHREKNAVTFDMPGLLAGAKPVTRNEFMKDEHGVEAYWKEWQNLEQKKVWKWETLTEWDDVVQYYNSKREEVHFGYLFGFMVIKGDEFPEGDPRRRYKYRIVFQGSNVKEQDWQVALFQEMTATPATLEAARVGQGYALFPNHTIQG